MVSKTHHSDLRKIGICTGVFALCWLGGLSMFAHAGTPSWPSTQEHLVVACDKSEDGLVVNFSQSSADEGIYKALYSGESCLQALAKLPKRTRSRTPVFFSAHPQEAPRVPPTDNQTLIWFQKHRGIPEKIIGCTLDEQGIFQTAFVNGQQRVLGEPCVDTLAAWESPRSKVKGPIVAQFGQTPNGKAKGGLLWVINNRRSVEVVECNLDPNGTLVTTYRESSMKGLMAIGDSCLGVLAEHRAGGRLTIQGPVPIPTAGDGGDGGTTDVPDCIIWDIDG